MNGRVEAVAGAVNEEIAIACRSDDAACSIIHLPAV